MLRLKKSIDSLLNNIRDNNMKLPMVLDTAKAFRKQLDGIEPSRSLADFTDYAIK